MDTNGTEQTPVKFHHPSFPPHIPHETLVLNQLTQNLPIFYCLFQLPPICPPHINLLSAVLFSTCFRSPNYFAPWAPVKGLLVILLMFSHCVSYPLLEPFAHLLIRQSLFSSLHNSAFIIAF